MDALDLLSPQADTAPEEAQVILASLLRLGADHWQHDYRDAKDRQWKETAYKHLQALHTGAFGTQFPKDYLIQVPGHRRLLEPMAWEDVSAITHQALRTMFRMPDYSCGSVFYPDAIHRWLKSGDPRGSQTSCFLRMLWSERQAPEWTLADLAKAPSKERALIARVKDALDPADVESINRMYRDLDSPIQEGTFWGRVGQVAAWLQEDKVQATRDQFGMQEDREPTKRHSHRWGQVARLPNLIGRLMDYNGQGRGWFEVPGTAGWFEVLDTVAMETGVYLWTVEPLEAREHRAATSGVSVGGGAAEVYLADTEI